MEKLEILVPRFLEACETQRNLSPKTVKAYRIDLGQYVNFSGGRTGTLTRPLLREYLGTLHARYKPSSVQRKMASLKALCTFLAGEGLFAQNPFEGWRLRYSQPHLLPRAVPLHTLGQLWQTLYGRLGRRDATPYQQRRALRDAAVLELLFATGMRVSELCGLGGQDVDLTAHTVRIWGKGARERVLTVDHPQVLGMLTRYRADSEREIRDCGHFFINRDGKALSEQSVRQLLGGLCREAGLPVITPHQLRHTLATLLLEEEVDIRSIQQILGHSSISTTQIYTQVTSVRQRSILAHRHPRNRLTVG